MGPIRRHGQTGVLVRHGETAGSASGRHTSVTDPPLTDGGREAARRLAARLAGWDFALVLTSPRARARETAALARYPSAEVDEDLVEFDYGEYEGRTTPNIREEHPGWSVWEDGAPGGEDVADVGARADRVIERVTAVDGDALVFAHGHLLRMVAVTWIEAAWPLAWRLPIDPATISILGWDRGTAVLERWNS